MFRKINRRGLLQVATMLLVALMALAGWQAATRSTPSASQAAHIAPSANSAVGAQSNASSAGASVPAVGNTNGPVVVGQSTKNDISPPLRDMKPLPPAAKADKPSQDTGEQIPLTGHKDVKDQVEQTSLHPAGAASISPNIPSPLTTFAGIQSTGGCNGCAPPDPNADVGSTQIVETVNTAFQVFNKTGGSLYGPANINTIWSGFGGPCQTRNDGDPVVLWDPIAARWLVSQFTAASPYNECIAISQTSDATGSWYRYAFQLSTTAFPDYPKFGVWPDGYYMSVNWFTGGQTYAGPRPYAFNRSQMLTGAAATFQTTSAPLGSSASPLMPADLDGATQPPAGAPNYFVEFGSTLSIFKFHVDWANPANTTWTNSANLAAAGFTQLCASTQDCVPQQGTTQRLDGLGDRLMFRLAYRNFGDHEAMVVNHSVQASGGQAGVRWYEIRNPGGSASIYQQGTYAPDSTNRWMGSVAMDRSGDIAVGYSVSSSSLYPGIRYTGRLVGDALGTLPQGEATIYNGTGFQSGVNRWGDYTSMSVDPTDDCTFWYTDEYNGSGAWAWGTRIGSFKFPTCGGGPPPTATPVPTNTPVPPPTNTPVPGATNTPRPTNTPVPPPTNTPTPPPSSCGEALTNGGFENGRSPWVETSSGGYEIIDPTRPHTGSYSAYLDGYNNGVDTIYQQVSIPSNATSATLTYWWNVSTQEACCTPYDYLYARVLNSSGGTLATLQTLSNASPNNVWTKSTFNLLAYKGQTIRVYFKGTNDVSLPTDFFIDDVSLNICH
ncbi:MAG: hypothetical protein ACR2M0_04585 [Chloroflexia bacterium]